MQPQELIGHQLLDANGDNVGKIGHVLYDNATHDAKWVTVRTGMFGTRECFVPMQGARPAQEDLQVPYDKQTVKGAPHFEADQYVSPEEESEVYRHYGMAPAQGGTADEGQQSRGMDEAATNRRPSAATSEDEATITRSEEQASVGVEREEGGKARVRKTVEGEEFSETVPVTHEELHVEREPITDADAEKDPDARRTGAEDQEFTLYRERPVVSKHTEPVEKFKVSKEQVTDEEKVRGEVQKEHVEWDEGEGDEPRRS